ncbi:acyl-CoA/acyl-ACP dehydrogenase [Solwaraspora sp. WMMD1047]|uniref:acyl-CoA dehydrogenase family protein n=1 Tax=Solwaraspora sp. WMMD1047 TaxID=3016102 RepID=UPI0024162A61|nr:acyl-CoA dehydrogenase family protein [Solwaraspora sp. WMMD1047]MDG4834387.1 acyl-CoA/acyl-ACP dehydrogenase [Solwaraspora sp. WMMD1047]
MTAVEERTALREAVRDLLDRECSPAVVRAAWSDDPAGATGRLWRHLAEAGVPALLVPESAGGLGLDETYLVAVLAETGYAGVPAPTVEIAAVAAPLLAASSSHRDLAEAVLGGGATVSVHTRPDAPVPYGEVVDAVLLLTRSGVTLHRTGPGQRHRVPGVDGARRLARIDGVAGETVRVPPEDVVTAELRATLGTAAELVGLARRMIAMTVRYVVDRRQFGVPIGSFQAVKHQLADALTAVEFAAPLVARAAETMAGAAGTSRDVSVGRDVSMAKVAASDAARLVAKLTLHCHGAMAYTTEYDHHLFAKRAWAQAAAWGGANTHRQIVAAALGLGPGDARHQPPTQTGEQP